ncbi:hypothetical protein G3I76_56485 [Streptomyces sp. SID11233]|uniref:hypothetical protein n=1 Tax=Streptomyces sp. SID11385 TaxID=2706031 RepID=UPI0013C222AB|nr:hypothetical protein [Streptomyces sp. SID11385]NEA42733.1 hypothetical protein [Streptomyces sp. SID11385]NED89461.1 hypothetical protein [Streptomyces sp. SID11233]
MTQTRYCDAPAGHAPHGDCPGAPTPAPHQVWQDIDPRVGERFLLITALDDGKARVVPVAWNPYAKIGAPLPGARTTRIRVDRFHPKTRGYAYVATVQAP